LLANAVKFTANAGEITIYARWVPRPLVGLISGTWPVRSLPLADSDYSDFLELCVSDNGIGISTENMEKLFLPFTQIDSRLARRFEGTGLGLSLVSQMTQLHGGTVALASAEGQGSRFAVWLPIRTTAEAPPQHADANLSQPFNTE
jgi:signal transduction histidine kinase